MESPDGWAKAIVVIRKVLDEYHESMYAETVSEDVYGGSEMQAIYLALEQAGYLTEEAKKPAFKQGDKWMEPVDDPLILAAVKREH